MALSEVLQTLAREIDADSGARFPARTAPTSPICCAGWPRGHFVLLGSQLCAVDGGTATVDESSRLGVARLRTEVLPELSNRGDLLVLAQATMPSFLRYGAYPTSWWCASSDLPVTSSTDSSGCSPWRP